MKKMKTTNKKCIVCGCNTKNFSKGMSAICKDKIHYFKCPTCGKLTKIINYKEMKVRHLFANSGEFNCKVLSDNGEDCIVEIPGKLCDDCWAKYKETPKYKKERREKDNVTFKKNHSGLSRKEFTKTEEGKKNIKKAVAAAQTPAAKEKQKQTMIKLYGVDNYAKTEEFLIKTKKTSQKNWGVNNPAQSKVIQERQKATLKKNHGVEYNYFMPGHAEKMIKASQTPEAKEKQKRTMIKRHGVSSSYFMPGHAEKMIEAAAKADNTVHKSKTNNSIATVIKKQGLVVEQEYQIGPNKFVDFKVSNPKTKQFILVEYNPTITHNYDINFQKLVMKKNIDKPNRPKNYHRDRSFLVEEQGQELIQWFEHYDTNKMIDFIKAKCGYVKNVIGARECKLKIITDQEAKNFFNKNHVLGLGIKPKINIGLFYNTELVSVMSFNNIKVNKTNKKLFVDNNLNNSYELVRFCNKIDYSIIGGAKKLFNYFIKNYIPRYILTYSDYNLGNGKIYKQLNFTCHNKPKPSCFWTTLHTHNKKIFINNNLVLRGVDKFLPRYVKDYFFVGTDKKDFIKRGGLEVYEKWPTNVEIMLHYGFVRVYDSGYKTWIWKAPNQA